MGPDPFATAGESHSPRTLHADRILAAAAEPADGCRVRRWGVAPMARVERHRENIVAKLAVRDRVVVTRWAVRYGLVEP